MPAYHSSFNETGDVRVINGIPLLPLASQVKGASYGSPIKYDAIDEALELFRPNSYFKNFEIKGNGDRLLIYVILFISQSLNKLKTTTTQSEAAKILHTLAVTNIVIPADAGFPLRSVYPQLNLADKMEGDQLRQYLQQVRLAVVQRLVPIVYSVNGQPSQTPSKWWLCFQKRHFMGKTMH
ncbi:actin-related protein 2/3 complex subunit 3 [Coemansia reversa NRRL 1564]|uniref:Actin-related protein 2/3 complex subunit 3 n=1 Tax=Coemansia reversa (strain ATCC 12441 / NRRL 1564) TaxID=763665 RepID=A0A2G5B111_COERN|nr:actin-related protein 2/3 complex subunit 3 [Coemansia reversa NRRL 1564]|eukprot:PIA12708.1 actin-related protein 2/3 complex subunit 3 [Coemansia reversa NRRL 1564]